MFTNQEWGGGRGWVNWFFKN